MAPFQACCINRGREDGAKREHKISNEAINVEALRNKKLVEELKEGLQE